MYQIICLFSYVACTLPFWLANFLCIGILWSPGNPSIMSPNPKMMPPSVAYRRTLLKSRILTLRTVALLSITLSFLCFSLLLLFIWSSSMFTRQQFKAATPCQKFDPISLHLDQAFMDILTRNRRVLFLLEPFLLTRLIGSDTEDFKWRFNLPQEFKWKPSSLTVGVFADQLNNVKLKMSNFYYHNLILFFGRLK